MDAPLKVEPGTVVRHTAGFGAGFAFVAETTVETRDGFATVTEYGHTEAGARERARLAATRKLTARKRACGFTAAGFREGTTRATFATGFAA